MTSKATNKFSPEVRGRAAVVSIVTKIGCAGQTLHEWVKKPRSTAVRVPGCRATSLTGGRCWSGRTASCARPTKSCVRHPHILRWRSSTAERGDGFARRRTPQGVRDRADLPASSWMRSSRRCMTDDRCGVAASSTSLNLPNTCQSSTPNAVPKLGSSRRSAASATAMTTLWRKPSIELLPVSQTRG